MKVGADIENDMERASTIRDVIGWENYLVSLTCSISVPVPLAFFVLLTIGKVHNMDKHALFIVM